MGNEYKKFSIDTEKLNKKIKELNCKLDDCYLEIEKLKQIADFIELNLEKIKREDIYDSKK